MTNIGTTTNYVRNCSSWASREARPHSQSAFPVGRVGRLGPLLDRAGYGLLAGFANGPRVSGGQRLSGGSSGVVIPHNEFAPIAEAMHRLLERMGWLVRTWTATIPAVRCRSSPRRKSGVRLRPGESRQPAMSSCSMAVSESPSDAMRGTRSRPTPPVSISTGRSTRAASPPRSVDPTSGTQPARAVPRPHRLIPEYPASLSRC